MHGQLFTQDFLLRGVKDTPPYKGLIDAIFDDLQSALQDVHQLNEEVHRATGSV